MISLAELCTRPSFSATKRKLIETLTQRVASICQCEAKLDFFTLKTPPPNVAGDVAIPCFEIAQTLKKNPVEVAKFIADHWIKDNVSISARPVGPYCNITLHRHAIAAATLHEILESNGTYGRAVAGDGKTVMIEYSSPNTNKPQHLGHIRNNLLGHVTANLLKGIGFKTIKTSLVNDRGIHICKSMLAYQKWGKGKAPSSEGMKGDHFVGMYYVKFEQALEKERVDWLTASGVDSKKMTEREQREAETKFLGQSPLMLEAQAMLKTWEDGDKTTIDLWKKLKNWVMQGFDETYRELGVDFDRIYFESDIYQAGRELILDAVKEGKLTRRSDGSILAELSKIDPALPDKTLLRADGTSLYITQDINLAVQKFNEYQMDYSIYCVGSEQDLYLRQLFGTLKRMGFAFADRMTHLSYGMVFLPEGKMKSREGKVVDADDLIAGMRELARKEVRKRFPDLPNDELADRAKKIGDAGLKYFILSFGREMPIHFDPKKSIAFEGNTGPYIQYTYARISSILRKLGNPEGRVPSESTGSLDAEWPIFSLLMDFPTTVYLSGVECEPSQLANALFELCRTFNTFYQKTSVIHATGEQQQLRIAILFAVQHVIKTGLQFLDIETLEAM